MESWRWARTPTSKSAEMATTAKAAAVRACPRWRAKAYESGTYESE